MLPTVLTKMLPPLYGGLQERQPLRQGRSSGGRAGAPQLAAALEFLRPGDTLAVWKFDRLARDLRHLIELGLQLDERGCQLASLT